MDDALPLHIKSLEFDSHQVNFFFFVVVCFFFCFVLFFKNILEAFCSINLLGNDVTYDS